MNSKKAKILRKIARNNTEFLPDVEYEMIRYRLPNGKVVSTTRIIPANASTRGYYRHLKKTYRKGLK